MRRRESGISIAMVLVVLVLAATAMLAAMALARLRDVDGDRTATQAELQRAVDAIDQFAAAQHRLPCPADPTLDAGVEAVTAVGAATCQSAADEGTLPWKTLGIPRDASIDAWGDKISYRVYTGNKGSLVQPEAVNMTQCDTVEPGSGNTTAGAGSAGGLCVTNTDPTQRSTSVAKFLQGKELSLTDNGAARSNVAYVVISHGKTGYGAYTTTGVRKAYSDVKGDELANTRANGPFTIRAFSDVDVEANSAQHFDDLILYRTLPDLVAKIGLAARDWPDDSVGTAVFNATNIASALGVSSVSAGDLGTATINMGGVTATASGGTLSLTTTSVTNPAPDGSTAIDGLGITGSTFGNYINSVDGKYVSLALGYDANKFAVTLSNFGIYFGINVKRAEFVFRDSTGTEVARIDKSACKADPTLASFSITTSQPFRSIEVHAIPASPSFFVDWTWFAISEVKACPSSVSTCTTSLASAVNNCP